MKKVIQENLKETIKYYKNNEQKFDSKALQKHFIDEFDQYYPEKRKELLAVLSEQTKEIPSFWIYKLFSFVDTL